jgi:hypothetical protein
MTNRKQGGCAALFSKTMWTHGESNPDLFHAMEA